jgi:hypothetical protein
VRLGGLLACVLRSNNGAHGVDGLVPVGRQAAANKGPGRRVAEVGGHDVVDHQVAAKGVQVVGPGADDCKAQGSTQRMEQPACERLGLGSHVRCSTKGCIPDSTEVTVTASPDARNMVLPTTTSCAGTASARLQHVPK